MGSRLFHASGLVIVAALTLSARPAGAQTVANGPYYAVPSWDQTLPCPTANCPRFVVMSNMSSAAVLDRETGLIWERTPDPTSVSWDIARMACLNTSIGGAMGFRLPSVHEAVSLFTETAGGLRGLPAGHPFNVALAGSGGATISFWTATVVNYPPTLTPTTPGVWNFSSVGAGIFFDPASISLPRWCVRGGGPLSAY
jgi:hypothetical protein